MEKYRIEVCADWAEERVGSTELVVVIHQWTV